MPPDYEQPPLPFEDEVLVVLHKGEIHQSLAGPGAMDAEWCRLRWRVENTAQALGFAVQSCVASVDPRGEWLHTQLRAEAERA